MKWEFCEPRLGDMIRVRLGDLYHYGIFVNENEVIQFGLAPTVRMIPESEVEVCASDIDTFLAGGFLEVGVPDKQELKKRNSPKRIVELARSRLGERGYNILFNNCEHFAYLCTFGVKYSAQAEAFRERFRTLPTLDVYLARIPEDKKLAHLYPKERDKEVRAVKNEQVRKHKYYAWRLLEHALLKTFAYDIKKIEFTKAESGKWLSKDLEFSISHSGDLVAVAVSKKAVGVDIQVQKSLSSSTFEGRMLTEKERGHLASLDDEKERQTELIKLWTIKESIFKTFNSDKYIPAEIETSDYETHSETVDVNGVTYHLAVCGSDISKIRIFKDIIL
jgi:phosphopantetheinyl transferase (holo-ACP synthase)